MLQWLLSWRILLALVAIMIVSGTISYSSISQKKIEGEERQKYRMGRAGMLSIPRIYRCGLLL